MIVRFQVDVDIPYDDVIRVRAPEGVIWNKENLRFSTANADTDALSFNASKPEIPATSQNILHFQILDNLPADFEFGFRGSILIPDNTPVPNRWWIEQFRVTGLVDAPYDFISNQGTEGFKTQILVSVSVTPYNTVEEAWENPSEIIFETTEPVAAEVAVGSSPAMPAEFRLVGPPGYTFICPIKPLDEGRYAELGAVFLPRNFECVVYHTLSEERNVLHVYYRYFILDGSGLE